MNSRNFVVDFEKYVTIEKRFSGHTVVAYIKDVTQFLEYANILTLSELKEVEHQLIRGWIVELVEAGVSNRSVNRKLSTLRTFFNWLQKQLIIEKSPMHKVQAPKQEKKLPTFAKQSEMNSPKWDHLFSNDFEGQRDRLMVELFYQTGIRLSELIELKRKDVTSQTIKVLGKRNKERIIPIGKELHALIERYLEVSHRNEIQSEHLFTLFNGKKLYPKFVYRKINQYLGSVTNLDKNSPHVLRHTFATHMLNNGAGLETLKELLGHANLSATQVYTHNSFAQLNTIYSQAHPRGHKKD
ncbi:MAG: integrase [Crocinitomicaceae bacterium]|nr:MAG: integrase [Crocinitomicaceae bacterium]